MPFEGQINCPKKSITFDHEKANNFAIKVRVGYNQIP